VREVAEIGDAVQGWSSHRQTLKSQK
jgi:hypothetical protein